MKRATLLVSLGFVALLAVEASPTTYTVLPDGTGDFPTIQAAIDAASDGDIIELGDGDFTGEGNCGFLYMGKAVTVRSISGDPESCTISGSSLLGGTVLFTSAEGAESLIQGVAIIGGAPGIHCSGSSPTIQNVVLRRCLGHWGGAMYCSDGSPVLIDVLFEENVNELIGSDGGGMYCENSYPTLSNVVFTRNVALNTGAMYCWGGHATLTDVAFLDNGAWGNGGMSCESATLTRVRFEGNFSAYDYLGGLEIASGALTDVIFTGNTGMAIEGGWPGPLTLTRVTCAGNSGCAFCGSAVIENSTFVFNGQAIGGGEVRNSIIAFNGGAAVSGSATLECCNLYGNTGGDWVGNIADQYGVNGNIRRDPWFCADEHPEHPYTLHSNSCCVPYSPPNEECGLIGAWPVGCGPSPVEEVTWGSIKAMYRVR